MAKIFFVGLDGAEKSYRLQTHRPFTLGRDPGNDIILRDPKVSRHHGEIVFERGFFVLHDLASANGTYVNGKRIRVAPLTHGARLRMGNTYGRFSEELPTESEAAPMAAAEPFDQPVPPPTEDLGAMMPTSSIERVNLQTVPHDKMDPAELKKKSGVAAPDVADAQAAEHEPPTEPIAPAPRPPAPPASSARAAPHPNPLPGGERGLNEIAGPFAHTRYRFTTGLRAGEVANIRGEDGQVLLSYRSFANVVGIVAALVSGIVTLAGLAAVLFLIAEKSPSRAFVALVLTLLFAFFIAMLVPRINVTLYDEHHPALTISQRTTHPGVSYVVATPNGATLAELRKTAFSRLGRHRWRIVQEGRLLAEAVEESWTRAMVRKALGKFSRRFETNLLIEYGGLDAGRILRRADEHGDVDLLELTNDAIDRRVAVALATLVLGREP